MSDHAPTARPAPSGGPAPRRPPPQGDGDVSPLAPLLLPVLAPLLLAGCGSGDGHQLPVLYETPAFALTDQAGDTLRASELEGQAWVVHPFFTSCRNVCPATTRSMAALRDSLAADGVLGERVRLISVSVDPARDTTAALRRWAEQHGDSPPGEWAFLRGEPPAKVRSLVQEGFHLSAMLPPASDTAGAEGGPTPSDEAGGAATTRDAGAPPGTRDASRRAAVDTAGAGYQVIHASQVLLVDGRGRVRGTYEILRPADFGELVSDTRRLARTGG